MVPSWIDLHLHPRASLWSFLAPQYTNNHFDTSNWFDIDYRKNVYWVWVAIKSDGDHAVATGVAACLGITL